MHNIQSIVWHLYVFKMFLFLVKIKRKTFYIVKCGFPIFNKSMCEIEFKLRENIFNFSFHVIHKNNKVIKKKLDNRIPKMNYRQQRLKCSTISLFFFLLLFWHGLVQAQATSVVNISILHIWATIQKCNLSLHFIFLLFNPNLMHSMFSLFYMVWYGNDMQI